MNTGNSIATTLEVNTYRGEEIVTTKDYSILTDVEQRLPCHKKTI